MLHNLRRVEAGLRGENLGEDLTFRKYEGDELPELMPNGVAEDVGDNGYWGSTSYKEKGGAAEMEGEWQDKAEFERQQEVVQGEVGRRNNAVEGGFEEEGGIVPRVKATWDSGDKDAKRKAKKERRKKLQAEAEAQRRREKNAEQD